MEPKSLDLFVDNKNSEAVIRNETEDELVQREKRFDLVYELKHLTSVKLWNREVEAIDNYAYEVMPQFKYLVRY